MCNHWNENYRAVLSVYLLTATLLIYLAEKTTDFCHICLFPCPWRRQKIIILSSAPVCNHYSQSNTFASMVRTFGFECSSRSQAKWPIIGKLRKLFGTHLSRHFRCISRRSSSRSLNIKITCNKTFNFCNSIQKRTETVCTGFGSDSFFSSSQLLTDVKKFYKTVLLVQNRTN